MEDYNKKLYNYIVSQIKDTKYLYNRGTGIKGLIDAGINNYGLVGYSNEEWKQAMEWAIADVYGGGCEVENV